MQHNSLQHSNVELCVWKWNIPLYNMMVLIQGCNISGGTMPYYIIHYLNDHIIKLAS